MAEAGDEPRARAAAVVLAAGAGRRFGQAPKQLAELDGRPLLQHALDALLAVEELDPLVVVLGARAAEVGAQLTLRRASVVVCPGWESGMAASLRTGVAAVEPAGREWLAVALGDQAGVDPGLLRRLLATAGERGAAADAVRARYGDRPGHPVLLHRRLLPRLHELRGDVGARAVLARASVVEVDAGDASGGVDVDTPEDLRALRRRGRRAGG